MIEIQLTQGKVTQVDDEFAFLDQHNWYAVKIQSKATVQYYATRKICLYDMDLTIRMHRVVMELTLNRPLLRTEEIDHIDHDGLNNTLSNLRIATHAQNAINSRKQNVVTCSQFKGVVWHKKNSKWQAQLHKDGKNIYLGGFIIEEDAARAYDAAAKLYFGEYANLNFPEIP